jgi:uncharacterized protein
VQYNVSKLLKEGVGSTREYDVDDSVPIDDAGSLHERVVGRTAFLRTKDGVLVTAHLQSTHRAPCDRCLREFDVRLPIDIEEEFFASVDAETSAVLPAPGDPDAFRIDSSHTLDLEEAVRQYWVAAIPVQPLCRADCRGLCPRCGRDLNEGDCSCRPEQDQRWNALRHLEREMERK